MKGQLIALGGTVLAVVTGGAGELPALLEKPFLGCFIGFQESRDFQFALGADGSSELFFMKERDVRLTTNGTTLKIYYVLEEIQDDKEGWKNRRMQEGGFETAHEATIEPEPGAPMTFVATYTGGTKVQITHVFTDDGVQISARIIERESENEMRAGVRVVVGDLYGHLESSLDERDLRRKIDDSRIEVWPTGSTNSSGERIDLHEGDVVLQEKFPKGARKVALESPRLPKTAWAPSNSARPETSITGSPSTGGPIPPTSTRTIAEWSSK
jgi:hypothetical protein